MIKVVEGIILKTKTSNNNDVIITLIEKSGNVVDLLLKKHKKSKNYIYCEIGNKVVIDYSNKYKIGVIKNVLTIQEYKIWKGGYKDILMLSLVLDITYQLTKYSNNDTAIYLLLSNCLELEKHTVIVLCGYILKIMHLNGYIPDISNLKSSIKIRNDMVNLKLKENEIGFEYSNNYEISLVAIKTIDFCMKNDIQKISRIKSNNVLETEMFKICKCWVNKIITFDFDKYEKEMFI